MNIDAEIQRVSLNIADAEQKLKVYRAAFPWIENDDAKDPYIIEYTGLIADWQRELETLRRAQQIHQPKAKPGRRQTDPRIIRRAIELKRSGKPDKEIAAIMEAEFPPRSFTTKQIGHYCKNNSPK